MARQLFRVENGFMILPENGISGVSLLTGSAAPGLLQPEIDAIVGSKFYRTNGDTYSKISSGTGVDKWVRELTTVDLLNMSPRSEKVTFATGVVAPVSGNTINFATPLSDDETPFLTGASLTVGNYAIFGVGGTPKLMQISVIASNVVTFVDAADPLADNDYFIVQNYLPDSAGDQESQALVHYNAGTISKIGDFNWNFANGIGLAAGYAAASGNITASDSVQSAIAKLDGVNDNQDTSLGLAQGATHFGTFTGTLLTDNQAAKPLFQILETEMQAERTLSGTAAGATNLGTFTGSTIADSSTVKAALQSLETSLELNILQKKVAAITTEVSVDEFLVDDIQACKWQVYISLDSAPAQAVAFDLFAAHNGTTTLDAALIEDAIGFKLKFGAAFTYTLTVDLSGTATSQLMRLRLAAPAAVTCKVRRNTLVE